MALSVVDCGCHWGDGSVCLVVAAGHQANAAFNGLYVQRDELDLRVAVLGPVVWRNDYAEQRHRFGDYHCRDCTICESVMYKLLVIVSVLAAAGAQMLLKQGARKEYPTFLRQYLNPWVIGGYGIMGASLLLNIFCLSHGVQVKEVSTIESLSYLFVPALSWFLFKENITWKKAGAIAVIMAGVAVFFI